MKISLPRIYILALLLICCWSGCDRPAPPTGSEGVSENVPSLVAGHTYGTIGRYEPLNIQLSQSVPGNGKSILKVAPEVSGTYAVDGNRLSFTPTDGWEPGKTYRATLRLNEVESGTADYTFSVTVPTLKLRVNAGGIYFPDPNDPLDVGLRGTVETSDEVSMEELKGVLSAQQDGNNLNVEITEGVDRRHYDYLVSGVRRGKAASEVVLSIRGEAAGFETRQTEVKEPIAAQGVFELSSVSPDPMTDRTVRLVFTEPVDREQDLSGLLRFASGRTYSSRIEGNQIYLFLENGQLGTEELLVEPSIRSAAGNLLAAAGRYELQMGAVEPGLRPVGEGVVMPHQGPRYFTFEAIGLNAIRFELFKIYAGNVGQFLGQHALDMGQDDWSLRTLGQVVASDRIELSELGQAGSDGRWTRYALDLGKYVQGDEGALYQVRLGFGLEDANNSCGSRLADYGLEAGTTGEEDRFRIGFPEGASMMGDYYGIDGNYEGFEWDDREDPCKPAYYNRDRFVSRNVLSSNLGLIVKRNPDRSTVIFATDLLTAQPRAGVTITVFSEQQQQLATGKTDAEGRLLVETEEMPALIRGTEGSDFAYLEVDAEMALNLGRFDISGTNAAGGVKGSFYAERGVWRPGDSIFLNFVLEDRQGRLPADYPVQVSVRDAQGREVLDRVARPVAGSGLYPIYFASSAEDGTGRWSAEVKAAGQTYTRQLLVETVKPNRLAIELERKGRDRLALSAKWLYGAPASGLAATVEAYNSSRIPDFPKWSGYSFQDPARGVPGEGGEIIFEGNLDGEGRATIAVSENPAPASGPLLLHLSTKVFEPGGNFSIDNQRLPSDPFAVYAGIKVPEGRWGGKVVSREGTTVVPVSAVDTDGNGLAGRKLTAGLYRVDWRYWWQDDYDNVSRFSSSQHTQALTTYQATTGSDGSADIRVSVDDWGRYLLRICDEGGHCTGEYFYGGYGGGDGDRESAALLRVGSERESLKVGEEAVVSIPSSAGGRILVSLETGAGTLRQFWVDAKAERTEVRFPTTADMVPTVYASLTLLQPYDQTTNDRPARLYGVVPLEVVDPATQLQPVVGVADEWKPASGVEVMVTEKNGRDMVYTVDVVDEGLLGLTRFQTPDLHAAFFGKEALSVRTYDFYRFVLSSLGGVFGQALAIGGGGMDGTSPAEKANRFEPVVRHLGPFRLGANKMATHQIELPNYVGAVRVMVVGTGDRAYGSVAKTVPVRQPLMVLPTLPRVLGPGERVDMPVNVFVMDDKIRSVEVNVSEASGLTRMASPRTSVNFTKTGDQLTYVPLTVGDKTGVARFEVAASGGGNSASQEIEIDVRQPNEVDIRTEDFRLAGNTEQTMAYEPFGVAGSQSATLELSKLPPLQLSRHLEYLLRYPYGCAEQTISPAFAQLVLDKMTELTTQQEELRTRNVQAGIDQLRRFQLGSGAMAYWPGQRQPHPWASNYALHFLTEAERAGFVVPFDLKKNLLDFQAGAANRWRETDESFYASTSQLQRDQAYRLFGLALAGRADLGAMNRLRGRKDVLPTSARFQLAAAYALAGRKQVADELIQGVSRKVEPYRELGYTFGSQLRDMAMVLESLVAIGDQDAAADQARAVAQEVNRQGWLSTQEAAISFAALAKIMELDQEGIQAEFALSGGQTSTLGGNTGLVTVVLPAERGRQEFRVKNLGSGTLYATVVRRGRPAAGEEVAVAKALNLEVRYLDRDGNAVNVDQLSSGTEFTASYTVTNPGSRGTYRQMALRTLLPSGWEVANDRLEEGVGGEESSYDYQDFRDDRVHTFFSLGAGQSKTFSFRVTATYPGRYYLPAQVAEAMYDNDIRNVRKGKWVEVSK